MAVPWLQIVQLVPSIVEVSRDLLKSARRMPAATNAAQLTQPQGEDALLARLQMLEENERRQAELISQMAQQLDGLTRAATALHRRVIWLTVGLAVTLLLSLTTVLGAR
jgi:hypothetical protein